jgi:hypothetical protein
MLKYGTLNSYGFCANYTEIRRFLTSAANHEISKSQSVLFIPNGICLKNSGGGFIQEGSDNVDQPNDKIKQAMWNKFTRFSDRNF